MALLLGLVASATVLAALLPSTAMLGVLVESSSLLAGLSHLTALLARVPTLLTGRALELGAPALAAVSPLRAHLLTVPSALVLPAPSSSVAGLAPGLCVLALLAELTPLLALPALLAGLSLLLVLLASPVLSGVVCAVIHGCAPGAACYRSLE